MAKAQPKITLSPSRDIHFNLLVLSQSNVRKIKAGVSIAELAEDIARRTLLQSLNVRPIRDGDGQETGRFEVPAGGRRFRALELLVKQKRLAANALVPCVIRCHDDTVSAEEDSLAENTFREQLHPLDQFRAMLAMVEKGQDVEAIAAHFMVTPAVVRQRLKLATVSPALHAIYAEDGMTLEQLMGFTVSDDHARQEQVWELLAHSYNKSAAYIRQKLTENTVRVADKRVRFIGVAAYEGAGGCFMRDLFEDDDGGWLTDPALLDRLVGEKMQAEGERLGAEGWKWVATAVDLPWNATHGLRELDGVATSMLPEEEAQYAALQAEAGELEREWADVDVEEIPEEVGDRLTAIDEAIGVLVDRPVAYEPAEMALAGAFLSVDVDGSLCIERGYVRPGDEPRVGAEAQDDGRNADPSGDYGQDEGKGEEAEGDNGRSRTASNVVTINGTTGEDEDSDGDIVKPLPDRLIAELTAWRTLALQDALAQQPATAFLALLHSLVLQTFYISGRESCLQVALHKVSFDLSPSGLKNSAPAKSIAERHKRWKRRLPDSDLDLWDVLLQLDGEEQARLFAHCAAWSLNAQVEVVPKYDNGRISRSGIERRIAHSHVLARAVGLDLVEAGWKPTVADYFSSVTKPRILADVAQAKGDQFAQMIDHLKKGDMAREAERLLEDSGWLPEVMRTPVAPDLFGSASLRADPEASDISSQPLPAFLDGDGGSAGHDDHDDGGEHDGLDGAQDGDDTALAA